MPEVHSAPACGGGRRAWPRRDSGATADEHRFGANADHSASLAIHESCDAESSSDDHTLKAVGAARSGTQCRGGQVGEWGRTGQSLTLLQPSVQRVGGGLPVVETSHVGFPLPLADAAARARGGRVSLRWPCCDLTRGRDSAMARTRGAVAPGHVVPVHLGKQMQSPPPTVTLPPVSPAGQPPVPYGFPARWLARRTTTGRRCKWLVKAVTVRTMVIINSIKRRRRMTCAWTERLDEPTQESRRGCGARPFVGAGVGRAP